MLFCMLIYFVLVGCLIQITFGESSPSAESDYRELLEFDQSIMSQIENFNVQKLLEINSYSNHSNAINCANIALMYHERDKRWKQGGNVEALEYMNLALTFSDDVNDLVSENVHLKKALSLHKGLLLTELGNKHEAINIFNQILQGGYKEHYDSTLTRVDRSLENRDVSSVLYHKAEVLLTLFHDPLAAVSILLTAIDIYPCNYNAYLKVVMALKESNTMRPADWSEWIARLETAQVSIQQVGPDSIVFVATQNSIDDSVSLSEVCNFEAVDLSSSISSLNNVLHIDLIRGTLYHALFLATEASGDRAQAWKYLQLGRHMDRQMAEKVSRFSLSRSIQQAAHVTNHFQAGYWPPAHLATKDNMMGSASRIPVFIVGFFRSGSTLLETMLDAHPLVWGLGESSPFGFEMYVMQDHMREVIAEVKKHGGGSAKRSGIISMDGQSTDRNLSDEAVSEVYSSPYTAIVKEHADRVLSRMTAAYHEHLSRVKKISAASSDVSGDPVVLANEQRATRLVDKMLANYYNIGIIHLMFPRAIILHTVRDPLDTLFSCYRNRFADPGSTYTLNFRSLVRQYTLYLEIVAHFRKVLPIIQLPKSKSSAKRNRPAQALVDVRYEELVANPEGVMRRVLSLIGLPWDERVLNFHERNRTVYTASALQVKRSIYRSSVGQWREYAKQLNQTLVPELRAELRKLSDMGVALPFSGEDGAPGAMNWALSDRFDYSAMMDVLSGGK
jgi:tetratricopeptide (TPR) repeat protein